MGLIRVCAAEILLSFGALFGQTASPSFAPASQPASPPSSLKTETASAQRITNVMDRYPQLSHDGTTLVFDSNRSGTWQIYTLKVDGGVDGAAKPPDQTAPLYRSDKVHQITNLPFAARCPCWSPDMKKLAFAGEPDGHSEIFVMDSDGSHVVQLTHTGGDDSHPHWSADGSRIMFNSSRTTPDPKADWSKQWHELFSMKPDGTDVRQHTHFKTVCTFGSFSPDMKKITYRKVIDGPGMQWDLTLGNRNSEVFVADADGSHEINVSQSGAYDGWPVWSPDGKTIAFTSNRSGPANVGQIYIINSDGSELRQITAGPRSFAQPSWSPDGQRIFVYENCETADYEYGNISVVAVRPK
jgi:TolB protein